MTSTPLRTILAERFLAETPAAWPEKMRTEEAGGRASRLVTDLLDIVSRLEADASSRGDWGRCQA